MTHLKMVENKIKDSLYWRQLGMGTEVGSLIGTDRIPSAVLNNDSPKIKQYPASVPERILVTVRDRKRAIF